MKTATEQKKKEEGARFVRYFGPLLDALRALGGSGTPDEVVERIALDLGLSDEVQNELLLLRPSPLPQSGGVGAILPRPGGTARFLKTWSLEPHRTRSLNQASAGTSTRSLSEMGSLFSGATS